MATRALVDDLVPAVAEQLVLDEMDFTSLGDYARAGVITLRSMDVSSLPEQHRTYERVSALGTQMGVLANSLPFWQGDLLIWTREHMPEEFPQLAADTGLSERTLLQRMYLVENIPPERRVNGVSYSCHLAVASLSPKEQRQWLKLAHDKGLSTDELRERMKAKRKDDRPELPIEEGGEIDDAQVVEVAKAILRDAKPAGDGQHHQVPNEDIARLRAALGEDE